MNLDSHIGRFESSWDPFRIPEELCPRLTTLFGILAIVLGVANLVLGWGLGMDAFKRGLGGLSAMVPCTGIILIAAATALLAVPQSAAWAKRCARVLAALVAAIAAANLVVRLVLDSQGIDHFIMPEVIGADGFSYSTSFNAMVVTGCLLLIQQTEERSILVFNTIATFGLLLNGVILFAYVCDPQSVYQIWFFSTASVFTSVGFAVIFLAFLVYRPHTSWVRHFSDSGIGSIGARRLFPLVVLMPLLICYGLVSLQLSGSITATFGYCVVAIVMITVAGFAIFRNAALENEDQQRINEYIAELQRSNEDKGVLIAEVYHRVKNNLQQVAAIIDFERRGLEDEYSRERLAGILGRVKTIAFVHQLLIGAGTPSHVDMEDFLSQVTEGLSSGFDLEKRGIALTLEAAPVELSIDAAVPVGLLVNELVTNSIKHAFPDKGGEIAVTYRDDGDRVILRVTDSGDGYEEKQQNQGIGSMIIQGFVRQLRGQMKASTADGSDITIEFKPKFRAKKV
ncbi:sensor histidine kinase [Acuticoccus sp. MNP-M23]|uniref:sensor histidine kinase n=1 Tax=Acuticoccus sp. MNP-M23 TaxID=3072793 RepID=UPI0028152135|nr:sensor histidine kinase [Acuticoccus sp. MNP-M23]WMS43014.1 sensor histidine kinase [Acuticoccus sp. MNP-M23]